MNEFVSSPTEVVKVGEPLPNSDEINKALEKGELYKRGFKDGYKQAIIDGKTNFSRSEGEWKLDSVGVYCSECKLHPDYSSNFCPNCGADMRGEEK